MEGCPLELLQVHFLPRSDSFSGLLSRVTGDYLLAGKTRFLLWAILDWRGESISILEIGKKYPTSVVFLGQLEIVEL